MAKIARAVGGKGERRAMMGIAGVIAGIGAALLLLICFAGIAMNRTADHADTGAIDNALTDLVNRTLMEQKSFALWDEAAHAVQAKLDPTWFDLQVGAFLTEGYGHDQVFVLDGADRVVYGFGAGTRLPATEFTRLGRAARAMVRDIRSGHPRVMVRRDLAFAQNQRRFTSLRGARAARWAGNLIATPNGPAVVAMMTMLPPQDKTGAFFRPGIMVSVVRVDNALLDVLGRSLDLDHLRLDTGAGAGGVPLASDDGTAIGSLRWEKRHPGTILLTRVLPLVALVLGAVAFYTALIFRRLGLAYSRLGEQEAQSRLLAMQDPLSGLANRRQFMTELEQRLKQDGPAGRTCVAYIDVDRFKEVNDEIGHGGGDALVTQIGPRLAGLLRPDDLLARIGGDEFAVIRTMAEDDDPEALGDLLMEGFRETFAVGKGDMRVTASIGIATAEPGESTPDQLLNHADVSLYRAKDDGRARYVIFAPEMADALREIHEIEAELRNAIGSKQLSMHYQPITSVRSGMISGFEALVRWKHPVWGPMSPARFIPVAEQSGLMAALGEDILRRVFKEAAALPNIDIAVNLSPIQLRDRGLPDMLAALAQRHRVDPRRIVLEMTETVLIDADSGVDEVFNGLRERGFKIALDDFGTGYSSLSYLQRFEFDKIKIDRSFVSGQELDRQRPIIQAIVTIGRGYGMEIVAEGVETAAEFAFIQSLGCTAMQGYWMSKPLPFSEAKAYLKRKRSADPAGLEGVSPLEFGEAGDAVLEIDSIAA